MPLRIFGFDIASFRFCAEYNKNRPNFIHLAECKCCFCTMMNIPPQKTKPAAARWNEPKKYAVPTGFKVYIGHSGCIPVHFSAAVQHAVYVNLYKSLSGQV